MNPERLQQVEELYHAAREDRAALDQADPELRREVEALLEQDGISLPSLPKPLGDSTVTQLAVGQQLGPYRIEGLLGAGGMGEVYQAVDTRLDRKVAIKISAQQFSERFEREARAIAALNHPHICTLYDVGPNYLVMELVEGETLKGPLPLDQALKYAGQICDALAAAHGKGIIHRDLKPGNIMVTKSGVKVLDFGLAKTQQDDKLTVSRAVMGTPAYMSPEQLEGKEADARCDIYSFGCVLYEMLTGKRVGQERTPVEPAALEGVLGTCLEKDPEDRWQSARDIKRALALPAVPAPAPSVRAGVRVAWIAVAGVLVLALTAALVVLWPRTIDHPLVRLDVDLGSDVSLGSQGTAVILSPDGTRLVYVSQNRLFTRRLDQPKATELAGTEGAYAPFFSPDGQWVAFFGPGTLKRVSVEGSSAITVCNAPAGEGGSWGEDGNIVAGLGINSVLSRIPASGGTPTPLKELGRGEATRRWPQILPGGKAVLFTAHSAVTGFDGARIEVMSLPDHRTKTLVRGGTFGRYLAPSRGAGHLVYVSRGTLFAAPFDPERLELRGTPVPVLEQVAYSSANGFAEFDFSRSGTLVYRGTGGDGSVTIQWLEGGDNTRPLLAKPGSYLRPRVSPDGQRLAMDIAEGSDSDIWVYDWQRDTMTRVTFGVKGVAQPVWSPDGRYIVSKIDDGMFWIRADGAGKPQSLTESKNDQYPTSFSPDGKRLAYQEGSGGRGMDLWWLPVESDGSGLRAGKPEPFVQSPFDERQPAFSHDGRWLAYASNESGVYQVYVRAFPGVPSGPGGKWQISNGGGTLPEWSRNGRELFFRALDNRIMMATYTAKADSFVADKPRVWSENQLADFGPFVPNYDLAPDGKRIAALMPVETPGGHQPQNHVSFLENFFDELRRRVPVDKK